MGEGHAANIHFSLPAGEDCLHCEIHAATDPKRTAEIAASSTGYHGETRLVVYDHTVSEESVDHLVVSAVTTDADNQVIPLLQSGASQRCCMQGRFGPVPGKGANFLLKLLLQLRPETARPSESSFGVDNTVRTAMETIHGVLCVGSSMLSEQCSSCPLRARIEST